VTATSSAATAKRSPSIRDLPDLIIDAMNARVPYTELEWAVPIHPTVSELIPTVLRDLAPP
jgi:hypothetical protein